MRSSSAVVLFGLVAGCGRLEFEWQADAGAGAGPLFSEDFEDGSPPKPPIVWNAGG